MRLMTWNCRVGAFRGKARQVARLRPDVVAVQEVESIDGILLFDGDCQPTFRDRLAGPGAPSRGIGVFSYTETQLRAVDLDDPLHSLRRYEARRGDLAFQVAAGWCWKTDLRETSYRQIIDGIERHADWIRQWPTVLLGDFNDNASYQQSHWPDLTSLLNSLGLRSAYHTYFDEDFGKETQPTHFFRGSEASRFHLDYCFIPEAWAPHIKRVDVGVYADWHAFSDHMPVVVDLDL